MSKTGKRVRAGIIGVTGIVGSGLLRTLLGHPAVDVTWITSDHAPGKPIGEVSPEFAGMCDLVTEKTDAAVGAKRCDVVFCAKKGVESMALAPQFLAAKVVFIDIGGEFRLKHVEQYEQWYKEKHTCPELLEEAVYGLPELFRGELLAARLVANPGCYATCATMAVTPFVKAGWVQWNQIIVDAWSGVSGAGGQYSAATRNTFLEIHENGRAYGIGTHKHTPEIENAVFMATGEGIGGLIFTPHLLPIDRGILATIYLTPEEVLPAAAPAPSTAAGLAMLRAFYRDQPFVRVIDDASKVETAHVRGTNRIELSCVYVERCKKWVVMAAIDNLVKGAYGQAIQNMNIIFGLGETTGLVHRNI